MPAFDGTGPRGEGSMTGGGRGRCNSTGKGAMRGQALDGVGRGGMPRGGGRGRCFGGGCGFHNPLSQTDERRILSEQVATLEQELEAIREQLNEKL